MSEPIIEDIKRLVLGPNDTLVVTLSERASAKQFHEVSDLIKRHFPSTRVLVITKDVDLSVVTEEKR